MKYVNDDFYNFLFNNLSNMNSSVQNCANDIVFIFKRQMT